MQGKAGCSAEKGNFGKVGQGRSFKWRGEEGEEGGGAGGEDGGGGGAEGEGGGVGGEGGQEQPDRDLELG